MVLQSMMKQYHGDRHAHKVRSDRFSPCATAAPHARHTLDHLQSFDHEGTSPAVGVHGSGQSPLLPSQCQVDLSCAVYLSAHSLCCCVLHHLSMRLKRKVYACMRHDASLGDRSSPRLWPKDTP